MKKCVKSVKKLCQAHAIIVSYLPSWNVNETVHKLSLLELCHVFSHPIQTLITWWWFPRMCSTLNSWDPNGRSGRQNRPINESASMRREVFSLVFLNLFGLSFGWLGLNLLNNRLRLTWIDSGWFTTTFVDLTSWDALFRSTKFKANIPGPGLIRVNLCHTWSTKVEVYPNRLSMQTRPVSDFPNWRKLTQFDLDWLRLTRIHPDWLGLPLFGAGWLGLA